MNKQREQINEKSFHESSVLVPFEAKWQKALSEHSIRGVLRKRIPKERSYQWIYMYINSPVSAISFRGKLECVVDLTKAEAVEKASEICLSPAEISTYFGNREAIGYYAIQRIEAAQHPVTLAQLSQLLHLHPPQGFLLLSSDAKAVIDSHAQFISPSEETPKKRRK